MKKILRAIARRMGLGRTKIRRQMHSVYGVALFLPLMIVGSILILLTNRMLQEHYIELLESDNRRVRTLLTEITTQAYNLSDDLCFDSDLKRLLETNYDNAINFVAAANENDTIDDLIYNAQEVHAIYIYTNNQSIKDYKQFHVVTQEIAMTEWYQEAINSPQPFWYPIMEADEYGGHMDNLCLVRRINLSEPGVNAVAVIKISDKYIRSRISSTSIIDAVSIDRKGIVYSSKTNWYGEEQVVDINYDNNYFNYSGIAEINGKKYFATVSSSNLYMTNCKMYISTLDDSGFADISRIVKTWFLILLFALLVPGVVLIWFANYFSARVALLREEMHKARLQDYNIISDFKGNDELTEVFEDLKFMVQDIKEKEAKMYESELHEKELQNKQQIIEFKMLASQINPHYLYNTLETIRMKSLTSGNREVADCIKILGKTLHYVLENTGTASTTLKKELEHVENYLTIQKLRFGDRINYEICISEDINPEEYPILPLLLQPVVENAVIHGLEGIRGVGKVVIRVNQTVDEELQIVIEDSGTGISPQELEQIRAKLDIPDLMPGSSIALYNIHQRMRLCYGENYGVQIESEEGIGTKVILKIPAQSDQTF